LDSPGGTGKIPGQHLRYLFQEAIQLLFQVAIRELVSRVVFR
jgi:hypothetical protein